MICENLAKIKKEIDDTAKRCGRKPEDIQLLAVSKRIDDETIREAWQCGQKAFGENFIQEALDKIDRLSPEITWHFIGHLQSNKAKAAARHFNLIETVDRLKIARALDKYAAESDRRLDILVQVNVGREAQKSGIAPENAEQFLREIGTLTNLRVRGLMTMPPYSADPEDSRPYFRKLKLLADRCARLDLFADNRAVTVSMGMSNDFKIAIEEGATLVRVGTAIFGERT